MKKEQLMKDLAFCQELMNRLVESTKENYDYSNGWKCNHTTIQNDIIRLRRELNEVRRKLGE